MLLRASPTCLCVPGPAKRRLGLRELGQDFGSPGHVKDSVNEVIEVLSRMLNTHKCLLESGVEIQKKLESHPVMYDDFLRMDLPAGTSIIGFADDALVVCAADDVNILELRINYSLWRVKRWLDSTCLKMAPEKIEA